MDLVTRFNDPAAYVAEVSGGSFSSEGENLIFRRGGVTFIMRPGSWNFEIVGGGDEVALSDWDLEGLIKARKLLREENYYHPIRRAVLALPPPPNVHLMSQNPFDHVLCCEASNVKDAWYKLHSDGRVEKIEPSSVYGSHKKPPELTDYVWALARRLVEDSLMSTPICSMYERHSDCGDV